MVHEGKPKGFFFLDHRTVDSKCAIITDSYVTPANVHDSIPYLKRLDAQRERFNFKLESVGLDAGYFTAGICKGLEDRGIKGALGYRRPNHRKGFIPKRLYQWLADQDAYRCPEGQILTYSTTDRNGYRHYKSDAKLCQHCPRLSKCTENAKAQKTITRHIWQDARDRANAYRLTPEGKAIYKRRKETVERSFADAKQLHGHRYARRRGLRNVEEQCLLAAACQNMKKIAMILAR